ncbi:YhgE/Pip domain-containing protein [uncultured Adlercreutzia sp.]|uniref:YhgE/Pip domain-containing protein n=1 Tax=uncultured Adlercreutzia sp. TaxID=875803 RepID=UPI0025F4880B|nr:YhgE/Pip domain-containing protein [uncultured Adlercreutzia sp.]
MLERARTYLGVIFAIFARDVRRVLRNPVALVITLGMIVMPSAYAWYVVAANWDPYNNTEDMLVAVANEDAGADSPEAGHLDVGAQVVAQLHDNHEMGWEFTDAESAVNGVYEGKYWAALVIPKEFSADFASVFTGDFTQPTIDYYVNEKPSSIAPKVTDAAANAVERAINENFVKTVTEKVVGVTQEAGSYAEGKADDAESSLTAGIRSAHDTVGETRATLEGLAATVDSTRTAASEADATLAGLQDDLPHLLDALSQSKELLARARSTTNDYGTALSKNATDGALKLAAAASTAQRALGTVEGDVSAAEAGTAGALAQAEALLADNKALVADLQAEAGAAGADPVVAQALAQAQDATARLAATVDSLKTAQADLTSTADALGTAATTLNDAAEAGAATVQQTAAAFQGTILPDITSALDSLVEACGTLEGAVQGLTPSLAQARAILAEMTGTLETSRDALTTTSASLATMEDNLARTLTDLTALQNSATVRDLADYLKADPATVGAFMAAPVQLETRPVYAVANYGSGVTPFFTNLALWVAGFILMAMVKLRVDPEGLPKFTATQAYFGRWLFYVVVGLLMGLVCCVGDLALGIQCESPAAFIGAGLLTVFVDVNLMFGLAYASRHIGKAIAVILLIMQIPGSSGMFPIEMMPPFFQAIHPLLPFTYSIDAMREAIGGFYGLDYLHDMLWLGLLFVPLGFAIGLGLGRADFNLTMMFDEKLGATDLLLAEPVTAAARKNGEDSPVRYRTRALMHALLDAEGFRATITRRVAWFRRNYPRLRRVGWVALVAQPVVTFAVMVLVHADVNTRVMMLLAMVVGIIVVDTYLVLISYVNTRLNNELALATLTPDALQQTAARQGLVKGQPVRQCPGGVSHPQDNLTRKAPHDRAGVRHPSGALSHTTPSVREDDGR